MTATVAATAEIEVCKQAQRQQALSLVTSEIHKGLQEYDSPLSSVRQDALSRIVYVVSQRTGASRAFADETVKSALVSSGLGLDVVRAVTERLALHVKADESNSSGQPENKRLLSDEIHLSIHLLQVVMLTLEEAAKTLDLRFSTTPTKALTGLLAKQPDNTDLILTTLQIFLHLNTAERLLFVHGDSILEVTRRLQHGSIAPNTEGHTLALELLVMLCQDLSDCHRDALKSLLRTVSEDLGSEVANILQTKSTAAADLDEDSLNECVTLLRKALCNELAA